MPQFDPSTFSPQIFWLVICFGFLFLMMVWVLVPRLSKVIETRERRIQEDLDRAKSLLEEVDALRQEAHDRLHVVRVSAREKHQQAIEIMQNEKFSQLHALHEKAASTLSQYFQKLDEEKEQFNKELEGVISQSIMTLAPMLMGHKPSAASLSPLVKTILKEQKS